MVSLRITTQNKWGTKETLGIHCYTDHNEGWRTGNGFIKQTEVIRILAFETNTGRFEGLKVWEKTKGSKWQLLDHNLEGTQDLSFENIY